MNCPFCNHFDTKVLDTRSADEGKSIRRRRECNNCQKRFTTYEKLESIPLVVVKKDGRRDLFDPNKILSGIIKACEKRPVSMDTIEKMVSDIERSLNSNLDKEITTTIIGEEVMKKLKETDEVAYVRFASVYREFKDVNTFIKEIEDLIRKPLNDGVK
ncbi:MAG: transcriptional regulator NrdR [Eubacteriales bacterium]|jgi:transcriptional repressor NrdR|nr:transcriptional regulator NrdR [Eubacteriales bacterium]NCC81374.1 transcriptional repressor NrdR [Clostridia bacterium]